MLPKEVSIAILIKSQDDMTHAVSLLSALNKFLDQLTEEKEKLTKPINAALKEIRSRYKVPETKLEDKIAEIRSAMTTYQTKQVALQAKKEDKLAEKLASGEIDIEKAADALSRIPALISKTDTNEGSVKFMPVKCFEVLNLSALPIEYHLANEVKIRAAMKEGIELPGVRYFVEQRPYNSRG